MSTRSRRGIVAAALLTLAAATAAPKPAMADDSVGHRITFTVATAPAPCLVIAEPETVVPATDPLGFAVARNVTSTVASCSEDTQNLAVSGSPAVNSAGVVRWTLQENGSLTGPACGSTSPLNRFVAVAGNGPNANIVLAATPRPLLAPLAPGASVAKTWSIRTACEGSSGSGETLSFTVTFLATLA